MKYKLCRCGGVKPDVKGGTCNKCGVGQRGNKGRTTSQYGYDYKWRKFSERLRAENPLCQRCLQEGRAEPATEVHHKVPIDQAPWLRLVASNCECLCNRCHKQHHADAV